jgi:hypothetical protein
MLATLQGRLAQELRIRGRSTIPVRADQQTEYKPGGGEQREGIRSFHDGKRRPVPASPDKMSASRS